MLGLLNSARAISAAFFMERAAAPALPAAVIGRMSPTLTPPVPIDAVGGAAAVGASCSDGCGEGLSEIEHAASSADAQAKPAMTPGLYVVATPIGNLRDVTLRALECLAAADLIACEDTRVTRKLLDRYGIATPLTPYHEHNAAAARPKLLERLAAGAAVA